jgi:hypothetical protein
VKHKCAGCGKTLGNIPDHWEGPHRCHKCKTRKTSKLEDAIRELIEENYPDLPVTYNDRVALGGLELDILFTRKRVAIEINGNFHKGKLFDAITDEQAEATLARDERKRLLCEAKGIKLHVIETPKGFSKKQVRRVWELVQNIIEES